LLKCIHPEGIPWPGSVLYNKLSSSAIFQRHYEMVADDILTYCRQGVLLDIGTGPAWLLLAIHRKAPQTRLIGIDSSSAMVTKAGQNTAGVNSIEINQGNADKIPFPDNYFDIVVSTASIHHWKHPTQSLNEIYRVLKSGGFTLIYDLVSDTPKSLLDDCKRQFGSFKTTIFWLHSFEEPFYSQQNFKALAESTSFKKGQTKFLGLLYCLILKKEHD
jgi:ubiquinone/menaquinone biosynthesis C-methylase UbiE